MSEGSFGLCCCQEEMTPCTGAIARAYRKFSGVGPVRSDYQGSFTGAEAAALVYMTNAQDWAVSTLGRPFGALYSVGYLCDPYATTHYLKAVRRVETSYDWGTWVEEWEWQWDARSGALLSHTASNTGGVWRTFTKDPETGEESLTESDPPLPPGSVISLSGTITTTANGGATGFSVEQSGDGGSFLNSSITLSEPYTLGEALTAAKAMLDVITWGNQYTESNGAGGFIDFVAGVEVEGTKIQVLDQSYPHELEVRGRLLANLSDGSWHYGAEAFSGAPAENDGFGAWVEVGKCLINASEAADLYQEELTLMSSAGETDSSYEGGSSLSVNAKGPGLFQLGPDDLMYEWGKGYVENCGVSLPYNPYYGTGSHQGTGARVPTTGQA